MKNNLLLGFVILLILGACDKIDKPRENTTSLIGVNYIERDNYAVAGFNKVLLEDYTGHTCGNCPRAAEKAEELKTLYKDSLIVIAVHAGSFANPTSSYPNDYRTNVGTDWDNFFWSFCCWITKGLDKSQWISYQFPYFILYTMGI